MDLQIALIAFGIAIICVVYWLSVRREKLNSMAEGDADVDSESTGFGKSGGGLFSRKSDIEAQPEFELNSENEAFDEHHAPQFSLHNDEQDEDREVPQFLYGDDVESDAVAQLEIDTGYLDENTQSQAASAVLERQSIEAHENEQIHDSESHEEAAIHQQQVSSQEEDENAQLSDQHIQPEPDSQVVVEQKIAADNTPSNDAQINAQSASINASPQEHAERETANTVLKEQPKHSEHFSYTAPEGFEKLSQIDYWVKLEGPRDVGRETILGLFRQHANHFLAPVRLYGQRKHDNIWADVEQEAEDMRFTNLVVTLQLVTATYTVDAQQLRQFSDMVEELSVKTGRAFRFMAPVDSALQQAKSLGAFRDKYDSVYLLNIRPLESNQFGGAAVDRCATQLGLEKGLHHYVRYKLIGRQKVKVYSVANLSDTGEFDFSDIGVDTIKGITFFTQPAVNKSPAAIYAEMVDAAKSFASRIKGNLTSPAGADLSVDETEKMRRRIDAMSDHMKKHGIAPGSDEALRIFSA